MDHGKSSLQVEFTPTLWLVLVIVTMLRYILGEIQRITTFREISSDVDPQFSFIFMGMESDFVAYNATAETLQAILEGLPNIGNVSVVRWGFGDIGRVNMGCDISSLYRQ